jgi:hypothetical protein
MPCEGSDPANSRTSKIAQIGQNMQYIIVFMQFNHRRVHVWPGALLNRVSQSIRRQFEQDISPRDNQRDAYEVINTRTVIINILLQIEAVKAA